MAGWRLVFGLGVAVCVLAVLAAWSQGVLPAERTLDRWMAGGGAWWPAAVSAWLARLADGPLLLPAALTLPLALPGGERRRWWLVAAVLVAAWALAEAAGAVIARPGPDGADTRFAGGRVAVAVAFLVTVAYLGQKSVCRPAAAAVLWTVAVTGSVAVGLSGTVLRAWWPLDACAGAGLGLACAAAAAWWNERHAGVRTAEAPPLRRLLYRFYERRLLGEVRRAPVPRHVGIILDGNRRYARQHGLADAAEVYELGARKLDDVLDWCAELSIPAVTLWVFSTENLRRSPEEVSAILTAVEAKVRTLIHDAEIHRRRVRVRAVGKLDLLPEAMVAALRAAEAATAGYDAMTLSIAVAYGGREEIADAVRALLRERAARGAALPDVIEEVTQEAIGRYLYTADLPDPDLIIRTSGEIRLSGFLLWQSVYSEFYFSDVYWPAFRKIDFLRAVRAFQQRRRRFGR